MARGNPSLAHAVICVARQRARREVKLALQRRGIKVHTIAARDISVMADEYAAAHRAELINEAKEIVERWRCEGFFGKRALQCANLSSNAQTAKP
jgi:hypothetical protein